MFNYKLQSIADYLGAQLIGDPDCIIHGLNTLASAKDGEMSFLASKAYEAQLKTTKASAVIIQERLAGDVVKNALVVKDPYLSYAKISAWFNTSAPVEGIHPSAIVADSAVLEEGVSLAANVNIGERVTIGRDTQIGPGTYIGDDTQIGSRGKIYGNVSVYHGVSIGCAVVIHSGAVVGADGFGFANDRGQWVKIHQLGGVEIGNNVEIGACTTIDRGALGNTVIEDGVILDNHVQIAHNVQLGENTAMAAYSGVAGSSKIGKNCVFAANAGTVGHITVASGVIAMARCTISKSIDQPGSYSSTLLMDRTARWQRNAVRFGQLDDMARRLKKLEKDSLS